MLLKIRGGIIIVNQITKNNLSHFMNSYHYLHDSYIKDINYKLEQDEIDILIYVFWSFEPVLKDNNFIETNKTKLKMVFKGIKEYKEDNTFSDYIDEAIIKYVKTNNREYIQFASDEMEAVFYVVCDKIEYEEIKCSW